jgi:hypothetical protein
MLSFDRKSAPVEEALLDAWQQALWRAIFDPLVHDSADVPEKQLENAIRRLNKALLSPWIKFHVRDLRYIWWEDCHPEAKRSRAAKNPRKGPRPGDGKTSSGR